MLCSVVLTWSWLRYCHFGEGLKVFGFAIKKCAISICLTLLFVSYLTARKIPITGIKATLRSHCTMIKLPKTIFLHFRTQQVFLSYFGKFQSITNIRTNGFWTFVSENRPFTGSRHMVRNKLHWDTNEAVGLPKQRNFYQSTVTILCFESPSMFFASQCNLFRTM